MGRNTKLTPEVQKRIADAIRLGAIFEHASLYGGITASCLYNWLKKGGNEKSRRENGGVPDEKLTPFVEFFDAIKSAEGTAVVGWLMRIEKAATDGEWTAAAWKLERRYPDVYGKRTVEVSGKDGGPVVLRVVYDNKRVDDPSADSPSEAS